MKILAIDVGTSSIKAGYWNGRRFTRTARIPLRGIQTPTRAEISPSEILRALHLAAQTVTADNPPVEALAFDAFSSGLVGLDSKNKPLFGIITHQDRRSTANAQQLAKEIGERELLRRVGNLPFAGGIATSTLHWLKQNDPATLKKSTHLGQLSSFIAHHLTGRWVIDPSQACFLGLMNIRAKSWDADLAQHLAVSLDSLPKIEFADEVLGLSLPAISKRLGIRPGTPIIGGFVDTSAALLNTSMDPGQLVHASGTTDVLALCVDKPHPAPHLLTRPVGTGRSLPNRWLTVSTISSAGSAIDWIRHQCFRDQSDKQFESTLRQTCKHPCENALDCSPYFAGDRTSLLSKTASFSNLTLATTRGDLLAALVAALAKTSAERYTALRSVHPIHKTVYTMGGAKTLAAAMHAAWNSTHQFVPLKTDALAGLIRLTHAALLI